MGSVSKAFSIVDCVTAAGSDGLPFARIVDQTDIPKASTHRLLQELVELSVLNYDESSRCYRGGLMLARLGALVTADYDLRSAARPFLQALHETTGHVATLGIRNDDVGIYIDKIEPSDFGIRLHSEVGKEFPLHCTAMGKILLGHAGQDEIRRLTNRKLKSFSEGTITNPKELRKELARVVADGYAIDREEITRGLMCVAAPIFSANGEIAGAISCTFPTFINSDRGIDSEIDAVVTQARKVSGFA